MPEQSGIYGILHGDQIVHIAYTSNLKQAARKHVQQASMMSLPHWMKPFQPPQFIILSTRQKLSKSHQTLLINHQKQQSLVSRAIQAIKSVVSSCKQLIQNDRKDPTRTSKGLRLDNRSNEKEEKLRYETASKGRKAPVR